MSHLTLVMTLVLLAPCGIEAGQKTIVLGWNELPDRITGKQVRAVLADGVRLEGRAISVETGSLSIRVKNSSDPTRLHEIVSLGKPELASLEVRRSGWKWKVIAPVIGFISFGIAGAVIGNRIDPYGLIISDGAVVGSAVGALAGVGTGLVVGWLADRHYVKIDIVP